MTHNVFKQLINPDEGEWNPWLQAGNFKTHEEAQEQMSKLEKEGWTSYCKDCFDEAFKNI